MRKRISVNLEGHLHFQALPIVVAYQFSTGVFSPSCKYWPFSCLASVTVSIDLPEKCPVFNKGGNVEKVTCQ